MAKAYIDAESLARGRALKRKNALAAVFCGGVPAVLLAWWRQPPAWMWLPAIVIGLLWGNAFEYAYHRWLLHWPRSSFGRRHLLHHSTVGMPNEAEHVTLGGSPRWIAVLFLVNGTPLVLMQLATHGRFAPGVFIGFILYVIGVEAVHWRIHMGEPLPRFLEPARAWHMQHHDIADTNYTVFFPVLDYLLHTRA